MDLLTTHVLDTHHGGPAGGLAVRLERDDPDGAAIVATGVTGLDGRATLHSGSPLSPGPYCLVFETGPWYAARGQPCRLPRVALWFTAEAGERYHLPLYIGPHSFTTYRGS